MNLNKKIIIGFVIVIAVGAVWLIKKTPADNQGANTNGAVERLSFKDAVGKKAPNFTLKDVDGNNVSLSSLAGKNVVLFFNEGLMCYPACMDQVVQLGKDSRFNNEQTSVFSVVIDSPENWKKAQKELSDLASAKILVDDGSVSQLYDVLRLPSVMHYGRYPGHTYFILDKEGMIRFVFDDPNMGIRNDQLFAELQKLQ